MVETRKRVLGLEHPDTLRSMGNLAFTLQSQDKHHAAVDLMQHVVTLGQEVFGPDHPYTVSAAQALSQWRIPGSQLWA